MARLMLALTVMTIVTLALFPNLRLPDFMLLGQHADFFYHSIGFFVLTAVAAAVVGNVLLTVGSIAALAAGLEMLQALVPGREVFLSDLMASLFGTVLSALIVPFALQGWRRYVRAARSDSRSRCAQ